jgi:hypothetical protein
MGLLYGNSIFTVVLFSLVLQFAALLVLFLADKQKSAA